ncbi:MAG TPA: DUF4157 domain-containing protein [Kofleriaceae bacterium]|nr:DUF4157 domain-containing protein [Kofleriaceae bacterium]
MSLAIWERARADASESTGRGDADVVRRFRELAARVAGRGGRLQPDVGRRTRLDADARGPWRGARPHAFASRAPGRSTLVAEEARSRAVADDPEGVQDGNAAHRPGPPGASDVLQAMAALMRPAEAEVLGPTDDAAERPRAKFEAAVRSLGAGTPLRPQVERDYSSRLGVDLGGVRLHLGSSAPGELGALAFAHGAHIAVAPEIDIESPDGEHVLAHELVHVAQNLRSGAPMQLAAHLEVGPSDSPIEQEAEAGAEALGAGQSFRVAWRDRLPSISLRGGHAPSKYRAPSRHKDEPAASMEQLVRNELELRADPARKAAYDKACAQIDILRIQALQYSFHPTGFVDMVLEQLWPWESLKNHFLQISTTNPYPDGSLLAWIQGARGVIRMLGDLAAWVATIADIVAAIAAIGALITSETIIGGLTFGAIAEIAATAAIIAALIKILLDVLDALLGIVQILILVDKIKKSKDPNERATLAAQLGRECNDLGSIVAGVVVQGATLVASAGFAAAVGTMFARSLKAVRGQLRMEFGEFNLKGSWAKLKEAFKEGVPESPQMRTDPKAITDEEFAGGAVIAVRVRVRKNRIKSKLTAAQRKHQKSAKQWEDEVKVFKGAHGPRRIYRPEDLPKPPKVDHRNTRTKYMQVYVIDIPRLRRGIAAKDVAKAATTRSGEAAKSAAGELTEHNVQARPGALDPPPARLTRVAMWPTMLDKLRAAKEQLPATNDHVMEQYERAREQAGDHEAGKVERTLGATKNSAGELRFRSVQVQAAAQEGAENSREGSTTAQRGQDKNNQVRGNQSTMDGNIAKLGGQKVEKPKAKSGNWFDAAKDWVYEHTIGEISKLTGKLQSWIARSVGKWAMARAGLTKDELDMAGIDDSMRADELKDHKSEADAKAAEQDAKKVDPALAALMTDATKDEQVAMQAMLDTQEIMTAVDEAEEALTTAIAEGMKYIEQVKPIIQHELETQRDRKKIDKAYVSFGLGAAARFKEAANDNEDPTSGPANDAARNLHAAQEAWHDLNIDPGLSAIDAAKQRFHGRHQQAANRASGAADRATSALNGAIGTTDYGLVAATLKVLEDALTQFDAEEEAAADSFAAELEAIDEAYVELLNSSFTPVEIEVEVDPDHRGPRDPD